MKKIFYGLLSLAALLSTGCDEDYALKTGFEAPTELITPVDDHFIAINLESTTPTLFEWTASESKYGGVVLYEVQFDLPSGDFSDPILKMNSSGGGGASHLSMTPVQLLNLAKAAGIAVDSEGEVKWRVAASQGGERKFTEQVNRLRLRRPAGIGEIPSTLYIYGNGFEAPDFDNAMQAKEIADGVFEIYAAMNTGDIKLTNSLEEGRTYYELDAANKLTEANGEVGIPTTGTGNPYRIVIDFNLLKVTFTEIQGISMVRTWEYTLGTFTYLGNHKFAVNNIALPYYHDWGYPEERYRFWVTTDAGQERWGSYHNDAMNASLIPGLTGFGVQPNGVAEPAEYYNVYNLADLNTVGQNQDWIGMYKLPAGSEDKHADVVIDMSPTGPYRHTITVY